MSTRQIRPFLPVVALVLWIAAAVPFAGSKDLTYPDILRYTWDLKKLAEYEPGVSCRQFSSYDPRSVYDPIEDMYLNWSGMIGNSDSSLNFGNDEHGDKILAEMEGPGAIVRYWTADVGQTRLKIYVDGRREPAVSVETFEWCRGLSFPFLFPLNHLTPGSGNSYLPIPYQKKCRVTIESKAESYYYHVQYLTFPKDWRVPSFSLPLSEVDAQAVHEAVKEIQRVRGKSPLPPESPTSEFKDIEIPPGGNLTLLDTKGPGAVKAIQVAFAQSPISKWHQDIGRSALRGVLLTGRWDEENQPAICCPVGDFFGSAPSSNQFRGLPLGATSDGMYSRWYMPFSKRAFLRLVNTTGYPVKLTARVWTEPLPRDLHNPLYFYAWWKTSYPNREADWPVLNVAGGQGKFVGVSLSVWNPHWRWWGEGDEKMYVDGEKFPSIFGTGTEDYFGYGYCSTQPFTNPYHNQVLTQGPENAGCSTVNRFQIADAVPFTKSFRFELENHARDMEYTAVAYWYGELKLQHDFPKVAVDWARDKSFPYYVYEVPESGLPASFKAACPIRNPFEDRMFASIRWKTEGTGWQVTPEETKIEIQPWERANAEFTFKSPPEGCYPPPRYVWTVETQREKFFIEIPMEFRPSASAMRATEKPKIDGVADEAFWKKARPIRQFAVPPGVKMLENAAELSFAYDDECLYFFANVPGERSQRKATVKERDGMVWMDDSVDFMISPPGERSLFWHFIFNPLGTVLDEIAWDATWNCAGLKVATVEREDGWTVEASIPLAEIGATGPVRGQTWLLDVMENDRLGSPKPRIGIWANLYSMGGFSNMNRMGRLVFRD